MNVLRNTIRILLPHKTVVSLIPTAPFNFDGSIHKPSHFPSTDCVWEKDRYWITMRWQNQRLGLRLENTGTINNPSISLTIFSLSQLSGNFLADLLAEVRWRLNLDSDISGFYTRFKNDNQLGPVLKRWRGTRPVAMNSLYETLMIYFVLQNATVRRSVQMLENLFSHFGKRVIFDGKVLSSFWTPEEMSKASEEELRTLKLGYRAKFFKRVSGQFAQKEIDEFELRSYSNTELKRRLLDIYGVGPASLGYLLFEDFYRYDFLETIPPFEQKILSRLLYKKRLVPTHKILSDSKKRWGEWRKLALHYLWEDLFWQHRKEPIEWLQKEIRL